MRIQRSTTTSIEQTLIPFEFVLNKIFLVCATQILPHICLVERPGRMYHLHSESERDNHAESWLFPSEQTHELGIFFFLRLWLWIFQDHSKVDAHWTSLPIPEVWDQWRSIPGWLGNAPNGAYLLVLLLLLQLQNELRVKGKISNQSLTWKKNKLLPVLDQHEKASCSESIQCWVSIMIFWPLRDQAKTKTWEE